MQQNRYDTLRCSRRVSAE